MPFNHSNHHRAASGNLPVERRFRQRACLHIKADVTLPGDLTIVGHTMDISPSGLGLDVPYKLEAGQQCEIEFNLSKLGGPKWVQVIGEVTRCVECGHGRFQAGMKFVDMDARLAKVLDDYVWSRIKR